MREITELASRVAELERRMAGAFRHGTVSDVDAGKQLVRLKLGDSDAGGDFKSPWVPYSQMAGAYKFHNPPSVGQQMTLLSPTGDFRQAVALPFTWSNQEQSPSDKEDEHVMTFGDITITAKDDSYTIKVGGTEVKISAAGVDINGAPYVKHDGHLIDKNHVNTQVVAGSDLSGPPP